MPPKQRIVVQRAEPASYQSKGMLRNTYDTVTSAENAPVVRSILAFGVRRPRYPVGSALTYICVTGCRRHILELVGGDAPPSVRRTRPKRFASPGRSMLTPLYRQ